MFCWGGQDDAGCIIYDEANRQRVIGTEQTLEQPPVPQRGNQTAAVRLATSRDTSFHFRRKTSHPSPLLGAAKTRGASELEAGGFSPQMSVHDSSEMGAASRYDDEHLYR